VAPTTSDGFLCNVYDKIMIENQEKRRHMEIRDILDKSPSKRSFTNEIHSFLKRVDARER